MTNTEDRAAADAAYRQALETAKAEHDALEPKIQEMLKRRTALRSVISGCSALLGEPLGEKYDWRHVLDNARGLTKAGRRA